MNWKEKSLLIECYLWILQNFMKQFAWSMYKLLIKINIVQTQVWEKPIYKLLCFRKQRVYERNLYHGEMNYFDTFKTLFSERNSEPIESAKIIHFAQHFTPCTCSYTWTIYYQFKKYAEVDGRYWLLIYCKILNSQLLLQCCYFRCGDL